jgi:hypothetical protein
MVCHIINKNWLKDELIIVQRLKTFMIHDTIKLKFVNKKKRTKDYGLENEKNQTKNESFTI